MLFCVYTNVYAVAIQVLALAYLCTGVHWYLRAMASARYCYGCRRKHRHCNWYGTPEFPFCGYSYTNMFRQGLRVRHPSWPVYEESAKETDETGARICAAVFRKDATAIREGSVLLSRSMLEPRSRILVSLLASTFYFPWPSHAFIHRIHQLNARLQARLRFDVSASRSSTSSRPFAWSMGSLYLALGRRVFPSRRTLRSDNAAVSASPRSSTTSTLYYVC